MLAGQIAWIRLAAAEVGCNLSAVVVLLTAAMVGLSIGSRAAGRRMARTAIGGRLIVQQLAAAMALLISPVVIKGAGHLAAAVAQSRGWQYEPAEMLAVAAVAVAILLFNVPFGMLLPMAIEIDAKHRFRGLSRQVGLLGQYFEVLDRHVAVAVLLQGVQKPERLFPGQRHAGGQPQNDRCEHDNWNADRLHKGSSKHTLVNWAARPARA